MGFFATRRLRRTQRKKLESQSLRRVFGSIWRGMHLPTSYQDSRPLIERLQSWVAICVNRNADEVSRGILRMYSRDKTRLSKHWDIDEHRRRHLKSINRYVSADAVEMESHAVLDLLNRPNPVLDGCGFLNLLCTYLEIFGDSITLKARDDTGTVRELWPLPNQYVFPVLGPENVIDVYEFRYGGQIERYQPKDIMRIRCPSPIDMVSGLGPLKPALHAAEANIRLLEWQQALFQNMGVPDLMIQPDEDEVTQEQMDQLMTDWEAKFGGWRQRGKPGFMPFRVKTEKMGYDMRQTRAPDILGDLRDEIAAAFGVPMPVLKADSSTFSNMKHGLALWMRTTIGSYQTKIATALNNSLLPDFIGPERAASGRMFVAFDNPAPDDEEAEATMRREDYRAGILLLDEARESMGRPPHGGPAAEAWVPAGMVKLDDPTTAELQGRQFDLMAEQIEVQRAAHETTAATETTDETPLTAAELSAVIQTFTDSGDKPLLNAARDEMARRLGTTVPPVVEVLASSSGGTIQDFQPEDAANEQEGAQEDSPEAEDEDGDSKPKDGDDSDEDGKSADVSWPDGYPNHLTKALYDMETKVALTTIAGQTGSFAHKLQATFREWEADVMDVLSRRFKSKAIETGDEFFGVAVWVEHFAETSEGFIEAFYKTGLAAGARDLGGVGIAVVEDPMAVLLSPDRLIRTIAETTKDFSSKVVQVTGDQLSESLGAGLREGENINQLAARVAKIYDEAVDYRAERIARTEVNRAGNQGAMDIWQEAGIKSYEWLATADACQFCLALNGRRVSMGKSFVASGSRLSGTEGGAYTARYGDVRHPPLHPNDRCTIVPIVEV